MSVFLFSLNIVLPILLLTLLGFVLKQINFFTSSFLRTANTFVFKVCLPVLLFINVYNIETFENMPWDVVLIAAAVTFCSFVLGIAYVKLFIKKAEQQGVVLQGFFRSNYIVIGLPLAFSIAGEESQILSSILAAFMVPLYNTLAVISLTVFLPQQEQTQSFFKSSLILIKKIITNPLIIGAFSGLLCLVLRPYVGEWRLKTSEIRFIFSSLETLSRMATPLALVALGGEFSFSEIKRLWPQIFQTVSVRLLVFPIAGFLFISCMFPHYGAVEYAALLGLFASPSAVSSAVMAQSMGNDGELARQIVVWTSVFSAFTLFAFVAFFRTVGIF